MADSVKDMTSATTYVRKSNPKEILELWQFLDQKVSHSSDIKKAFGQTVLTNALSDKLIVIEEIGSNGDNNWIFRYKPSYDRSLFGTVTHDWYCFDCHLGVKDEPLVGCQSCFRSFHRKCPTFAKRPKDLECVYCLKTCQVDSSLKVNRIGVSEMNRFFGLVMKKLEQSVPGFDIYYNYRLIRNPMSEALVYKYLDLDMIKTKILSEEYENIYELENDFKLFVHNFMVLRIKGLNSMFEVFLDYHFSRLKMCCDCYDHCFNDRFADSEWFLEVCDPPHPIIWAKTSGDPWWPAKVIESTSKDTFKIQFFSSRTFAEYLFEVVSISATKPIDYTFERKKFCDNRLRPFLVMVDKHLKSLIGRGVDPQNQYSKAIQMFDKNNIHEPYLTMEQRSHKNETSKAKVSKKPKKLNELKESKESNESKKSKDGKTQKKSKKANKSTKTKESKQTKSVSFDMTEAEYYSQSKDTQKGSEGHSSQNIDSEPKSKNVTKVSVNVEDSEHSEDEDKDEDFVDIFSESDPYLDCWAEPKENTPKDSEECNNNWFTGLETSTSSFERFLNLEDVSDEEKFKYCISIIEEHNRKLRQTQNKL